MYNKKNTKKFNSDLDWGTYWEWETIPFIENLFNKVLNKRGQKLLFLNENLSDNLNGLKEWDMKYGVIDTFTNQIVKTITFEIKADKYDESGNLFFEKSCSKKTSGLFKSKADFFVYFLPRYKENNFYIAKTKDLIKLIEDNFGTCISYGGGDGGKVVSYLINKSSFDEVLTTDKTCKLLTCDLKIPEKFLIPKFGEKKRYVYYADSIVKYTDPFDF